MAAQLSCPIRVAEEMLSQTWPPTTSTVGLLPNYRCESQVEDPSDPDDENNDYYAPTCKVKDSVAEEMEAQVPSLLDLLQKPSPLGKSEEREWVKEFQRQSGCPSHISGGLSDD